MHGRKISAKAHRVSLDQELKRGVEALASKARGNISEGTALDVTMATTAITSLDFQR